jgi:IS1 family transposase
MKAEKRLQLIHLLVEGTSVRSICRLTRTQIKTVLRHLLIAGERCEEVMDRHMRNLDLRHVQCDEIWTFCRKKQARVTPEEYGDPTLGDQYLFVALDTDTKLVPCFALGKRNAVTTDLFMSDLASRMVLPGVNVPYEEKPQISTDGWGAYPPAVDGFFGSRVQYGQIVKAFSQTEQPGRYGPPEVVATERRRVQGVSNLYSICTSHVERNNLTIRTFIRRFTRLSLGFSKKVPNLRAAIALHVAYYNFCRRHSSLRVTPAMAAGVTDRLWSLGDLLGIAA